MRPSVLCVVISIVLAVATGCDDLSRFDTEGDRVFRGEVSGDETESFIRRGFAAHTTIDLELHPSQADGPQPGDITTSPDPVTGAVVFDHTPLLPIAPLQHDALSEYDFPGAGRVRNYVFLVQPSTGPLAGRDAMVFISLLDDGGAEVRVIAGAGDESRGDHFGFFRLRAP